jgi:predicted enzyme related to lactoylglutathione lyase
MSAVPLPSVVLFVGNVDRVTSFYREVAAMRYVSGDGEHSVLEVDGFQLVVHLLKGEPEPVVESGGKVRVREDSYWKMCLPVHSIGTARVDASRLGGLIKPTSHEWSARGFRACDGNDPEGNVFQVRESAN